MTPTCDVESWADAGHVAAWRAAKEETAMFDRFTDRARKALGEARNVAKDSGAQMVAPEHMLVALLRDRHGLAARSLLVQAGVDLDDAEKAILDRCARGATTGAQQAAGSGSQMPYTPSMRRCFELASESASRLRNNYIGTEHLLLGIVGNYDCASVGDILGDRRIGLTRPQVVAAVEAELGAQSSPDAAPPPNVFAAGTVPASDSGSSVRVDVATTQVGQDAAQPRRMASTYSGGRAGVSGGDHECVFVDQIAKGVADAVLESFEKVMEQALAATVNQVKADFVAALDDAKSAIASSKVAL